MKRAGSSWELRASQPVYNRKHTAKLRQTVVPGKLWFTMSSMLYDSLLIVNGTYTVKVTAIILCAERAQL